MRRPTQGSFECVLNARWTCCACVLYVKFVEHLEACLETCSLEHPFIRPSRRFPGVSMHDTAQSLGTRIGSFRTPGSALRFSVDSLPLPLSLLFLALCFYCTALTRKGKHVPCHPVQSSQGLCQAWLWRGCWRLSMLAAAYQSRIL